MERFRPPILAPNFTQAVWLNSLEPLDYEVFSNAITLIDIFDYTCINCIRTLPYLRAWHDRYSSHGLQIIGIHTPEFSFAHAPDLVESGINRLGIHWPVILDNDQALWTGYANRYWPSLYLIGPDKKIHARHVGEGNYKAIEKIIQELLLMLEPELALPDLLPPIRQEDAEGAYCEPTSPELQLGAIQDLELSQDDPQDLIHPARFEQDSIYLQGTWRVTQDGVSLVGQEGAISLLYRAARVNAVLAPDPDDRHSLPFKEQPLYIQVSQDKKPLDRDRFGEDILAEGSKASLRVAFPRLYNLVDNPGVEWHELTLEISQPGLTFYAFSFGSCLAETESYSSHSKE